MDVLPLTKLVRRRRAAFLMACWERNLHTLNMLLKFIPVVRRLPKVALAFEKCGHVRSELTALLKSFIQYRHTRTVDIT